MTSRWTARGRGQRTGDKGQRTGTEDRGQRQRKVDRRARRRGTSRRRKIGGMMKMTSREATRRGRGMITGRFRMGRGRE